MSLARYGSWGGAFGERSKYPSPLLVKLAKNPPSQPVPLPQPVISTAPQLPAPAVRPTAPRFAAPAAIPTEQPAPPSPAEESIELPGKYLPLGSLTREPELLSQVDDNAWPIVPGQASGSFQLELGISSSGAVEVIIAHCEPALCPVTGLYEAIIKEWAFQPAQIDGLRVPSRLKLEFRIEEASPEQDDQPPRQ